MSTSTTVDRGDYIETTTGEPTWQNPTKWLSVSAAWKAGTEEANRATILGQAAAALATNTTYVNLASPSAVQSTAQTKALSRQVNKLIRLAIGRLEGTD